MAFDLVAVNTTGGEPGTQHFVDAIRGRVDIESSRSNKRHSEVAHPTILDPYPRKVLCPQVSLLVEDRLAFTEKINAEREGHTRLEEYRMTTLGVRPKGKGYEIYVEKQEFRKPPR